MYGAVNSFKEYGKPIWVTEFSCYGDTVDTDVNFVKAILPLFESDNAYQRYFYTPTHAPTRSPTHYLDIHGLEPDHQRTQTICSTTLVMHLPM